MGVLVYKRYKEWFLRNTRCDYATLVLTWRVYLDLSTPSLTERTWTLLSSPEVGKPEAEPFMECFFEKLESSLRRGTSANYKAIVKQALIEKSV